MEQALLLANTIMLTISFFLVGGLIGWIANRSYLESSPAYIHPEFLDENGNIIPDEILAVRFENDYDYDNDYEEEDDNI
jgi:hypothetical protein